MISQDLNWVRCLIFHSQALIAILHAENYLHFTAKVAKDQRHSVIGGRDTGKS
jgi:hypothetical protein